MTNDDKQHDKLLLELRRGTLVICVLSQLDNELYGYALMQRLTAEGLEIDQGTLYPLLRRLENQGLLDSDWRVDGPRPRRYYKINKTGKRILASLTAEWRYLTAIMEKLLPEPIEKGPEDLKVG